MSRWTAITVLTGGLLVGVLGAPALAEPTIGDGEPTVVCVRTDSGGSSREGVCVWLPIGR